MTKNMTKLQFNYNNNPQPRITNKSYNDQIIKECSEVDLIKLMLHLSPTLTFDNDYEKVKKNKCSRKVYFMDQFGIKKHIKVTGDLFYNEFERKGGKGAISLYMHLFNSTFSEAISAINMMLSCGKVK